MTTTEARTTGAEGRTPRATRAARSLLALDRLPAGSDARRQALREHGRAFGTSIRRASASCPI